MNSSKSWKFSIAFVVREAMSRAGSLIDELGSGSWRVELKLGLAYPLASSRAVRKLVIFLIFSIFFGKFAYFLMSSLACQKWLVGSTSRVSLTRGIESPAQLGLRLVIWRAQVIHELGFNESTSRSPRLTSLFVVNGLITNLFCEHDTHK